MRIAVLGTGNIGTALGAGWADAGHEVVFGTRDPEGQRARAALAKAPRAEARSHADAVAGADVVVLATPADAVQDVISAAGDLAGRIVVDATNAIAFEDDALKVTRSMAAAVAAAAPGARVVKAFNTIGFEHMHQPAFGSVPPVMLVAGADPDARGVVLQLADELGFDAVDAGPVGNAVHLEHLAALWVWLATRGGRGRGIAFALLTR